MKFCDRCYQEYDDGEIVQFDKESPKWICLPCKWEFDHKLKSFLIEFFNSQPERSKREDPMIKCSLCSTIYQDHEKDGVDICPECERDPYHMDAVL